MATRYNVHPDSLARLRMLQEMTSTDPWGFASRREGDQPDRDDRQSSHESSCDSTDTGSARRVTPK